MSFENLLIVGAGFSANAGLPLASAFTSALVNTEKLPLDGPSNALVRFVSGFVDTTFAEGRTAEPDDWPELEDVFTLVDLSANSGHHLGKYSASDLRLVRRAMLVRMIRMLSQSYSRRHRRPDAAWELLEQLFAGFDETSTAVLSMNWDTVIETGVARSQGLERVDYGCDARFAEFTEKGSLRERSRASRRVVSLTKPHGSVNWLYCDSCRDVFWVSPSSTSKVADVLFRKHDWDSVRRITGLKQSYTTRSPKCPHCGVEALGTRFATFSFRKALDFPVHAASWRTAETHLKESINWVFFGYSMPSADFEFKYLLKRVQLAERTRPRITVITGGGGAEETIKRFERFFGDVTDERFYFRHGLTSEVLDHLEEIGVIRAS
ncbi:hypothetical protein [Rhizobium leguminosarum]|uniref:hypothetical protein n=1 Tax=Rhizobium leguminosarum TaxID=384 RepID=UPI0010304CAD|nr:hypothetical protein [Rhizobium leguminosarum]TAV81572.1 hypothetical protein ELI22_34020 [Rhizobium leguminosarum]TAV94178.1 hypothetical protein ELI21_10415 [Rhizobium leguminosarum]TAW35253.1 hypothetical protein ELI23_10455 [Rhizobium leguminosarum]